MILIGLGANLPSHLGEPEVTLQTAAIAIAAMASTRVIQGSSIWKTAPVPVSDQPWYKNAVLAIETLLSARDLLGQLQRIENDFGRVRTVRDAPRLLDLDLLTYNQDLHDDEDMILPHPRMHQRAFVLLPLQEIDAGWVHPVTKDSLNMLIRRLPKEQEALKTEVALWP